MPEIAGGTRLRPPAGARVRVLIVDDSRSVRAGLSQLLAAQPYCEVVGAVDDPAGALAQTIALRPDVVLQDFSMPGVDPFRLIAELTGCIPAPAVLVLSATADAPSARQAIAAGAVGWVLKDDEPEQLFAALLGAAGLATPRRAEPSGPATDAGSGLDARTVWALLRALGDEPGGQTPEEVAGRAVVPVAIAVRCLQRLAGRRPALVAQAPGSFARRRYTLTAAGHREIERLERRIPAQVV